jgi:hypothetical protein
MGPTSEPLVMMEYQRAYQRRDTERLAALFAQDPAASFRTVLATPTPEGATEWAVDEEIHLHRRWFLPNYLPPGDPPVPRTLWLQSLQATFTQTETFAERTDLYAGSASSDGLDPAIWRASAAVYEVELHVSLPLGIEYLVSERQRCTVIQNLTKRRGDTGQFLLYRMEEVPEPGKNRAGTAAVEHIAWGTLKSFYRPLRFDSEPGLVAQFADAYRRRDTVAFDAILAHGDGAEYRFEAPGRGPDGGDVNWDAVEESRLQRRMFNPDLRIPSEPPVSWQRRLQSSQVSLQAQGGWAERADLYRSEANPLGLDRSRWRAAGTTFVVDAWFKNRILQTYHVAGEIEFVVIEDRAKAAGQPGKYLLYRWIDRTQTSNPSSDPADTTTLSWTAFKRLYG